MREPPPVSRDRVIVARRWHPWVWTRLLSLAVFMTTVAATVAATTTPTMAQTTVPPSESATSATTAREIEWHELAPPDQVLTVDEMIGDVDHFGGPADPAHDEARAVPGLNGVTATLTGYLVPITTDSQRRIVEFFLVPYYGACIHVPPPPANQIVHIRPNQPLVAADLRDGYRVTGRLRIARTTNEAATAVYAMDVERIEPSSDPEVRRARWLSDGITVALFLIFLFALKAIGHWHHPTRART